MDLQYFGANCMRLTTKKARLVIDDNLSDLGLSSVTKAGDIAVFTGVHAEPAVETKLVINQPGEYEVSEISVRGVGARAHMDEPGQKSATAYRIIADDLRIVVLGHIYPELSDDQLEALGTVDVLIIPVGGSGYTLDAIGVLKLIKKIEPKVVIPTHYADPQINYPVPQQDLEGVLKNLSMEPKETVAKFAPKPGELGDQTELVILERQ